jgi:hypothetical protein
MYFLAKNHHKKSIFIFLDLRHSIFESTVTANCHLWRRPKAEAAASVVNKYKKQTLVYNFILFVNNNNNNIMYAVCLKMGGKNRIFEPNVSEFTFGFYGYAKTAVGGQRFFSLST